VWAVNFDLAWVGDKGVMHSEKTSGSKSKRRRKILRKIEASH
jgi:hypothetical protein